MTDNLARKLQEDGNVEAAKLFENTPTLKLEQIVESGLSAEDVRGALSTISQDAVRTYHAMEVLLERYRAENQGYQQKLADKENHNLQLRRELIKRKEATIDDLTQIPLRKYAATQTGELVALANRHEHELSLAIIDLDHFKKYNDAYGHVQGDKALTTAVQVMKDELREGDILARFGGEEFVIVMPETNSKSAYDTLERIRRRLEKTVIPSVPEELLKSKDGNHKHITMSAGIATYHSGLKFQLKFDDPSTKQFEALTAYADKALYDGAKQQGRNRVSTYKFE